MKVSERFIDKLVDDYADMIDVATSDPNPDQAVIDYREAWMALRTAVDETIKSFDED